MLQVVFRVKVCLGPLGCFLFRDFVFRVRDRSIGIICRNRWRKSFPRPVVFETGRIFQIRFLKPNEEIMPFVFLPNHSKCCTCIKRPAGKTQLLAVSLQGISSHGVCWWNHVQSHPTNKNSGFALPGFAFVTNSGGGQEGQEPQLRASWQGQQPTRVRGAANPHTKTPRKADKSRQDAVKLFPRPRIQMRVQGFSRPIVSRANPTTNWLRKRGILGATCLFRNDGPIYVWEVGADDFI